MMRNLIVIVICAALVGCDPPAALQPSAQAPNGDSALPPVAKLSKEEKLAAVVERLRTERANLAQLETILRTDREAATKANDAAVAKEDEDLYTARITAATGKDPEREMKRWKELEKQVAARRTEWETQHKDSVARWEAAIKTQAARVKEIQKERDALDPMHLVKEAEALAAAAKAKPVPSASALKTSDDVVIDEKGRRMEIKKLTSHQYSVGTGEGDGVGFGGKSNSAKVRFIRLEYPGGDWSRGMDHNPDLNLLVQFNIQTEVKVAEQPEAMTIRRLGNFKLGVAPPLLYMTGSKAMNLDNRDLQDLRKYLLENQGMLFLDVGGVEFHKSALEMMKKFVPDIDPQRIPLDDVIHTVPNGLEFIPYIAEHGGRDPLGWKVDGRWIVYYHPGDIGRAWADIHPGVPKNVWEAAYDLGVNVMNYAYSENVKWQAARGVPR